MYDINTILIYGASFGILLMTIVYTFIRYIYQRQLIYISYCLMQIFSLVFLTSYSNLFNLSFFIQELGLVFASLFALVFAVSFYEGKFIPKINNLKELIINTFYLNVVILSSFYHYLLFEYLPYTIIYAILFISVIFNIKDGLSSRLIYVSSWSVFCLVLFIFDFKEFYINESYIDLVLLAFAFEAILFTLSLAYKYNTFIKDKKDTEGLLAQQSKLALTGEMIGNITHQFRQPLNSLSYILMNLNKRYKNGKMDDTYFYKKIDQAFSQIEFLSKTIEDFKEFYTPSKQKENFILKEAIENSFMILSAEIKRKNISLCLDFQTYDEVKVYGIKSELSQVFLSILSNSCEAFINVERPKIYIDVKTNNAEVIIQIQDNAGGIKNKDLSKIFDMYYSTKKKGSGLGLHLTKDIIEKSFMGRIEVKNKKEGACFTLFLEKSFD